MTQTVSAAEDVLAAQQAAEGHALNGVGWLDVHFQACRPEYEAMLGELHLQPGWSVLDAGCGSGAYFAATWDAIGPTGRIFAIDLDPRNVGAARDHGRALGCAVEAQAASLTELPFADDSLDAIWCANVSWLLSDSDLEIALAEALRVLKPGGRLGLKDVDMSAIRIAPSPPFLGPHLAETCVRGENVAVESIGSLRGRELRLWLERAGFAEVRQRTYPIERWAPLKPVEAQLWSEWLPYLAALALERGVPEEDLVVWRQLATPADAMHYISRPDFYCCEIQTVAVGAAPGANAA